MREVKVEKQELWICRHCHTNKPALLTARGKTKVARFRTGFVGVQLVCRHWAAIRLDKVQ